jgi:thiol-disulfide isomerase/thioredoxin
MFTLSEMRGRVVVVHFWASWCGYCRRDAPTIEALYHEYQTVEFIGISQDEDPDAAWRTAGEWRLSYPVGVDLSAGWNYGVNGIPATFVVDTEGRLIASLHGSGHENNIRAAIESALR